MQKAFKPLPLPLNKTMRSPFGKKLKGFMAKAAATDGDGPSVQVPVTVSQSNAQQLTAIDKAVAPPSPSKTNADRALNKVLKDLNLGELAVPEMNSEDVSEFDGQSAPVIEGDSSSESEDDVGRRVDAVVAAAEEIRRKKNAEKQKEEANTPEGRDEQEEVVASRTDKQQKVEKMQSSSKSDKSTAKQSSNRGVKSKTSKSVSKSESLDKILATSDEDLTKGDTQSISTFGTSETSDETFDGMNHGSQTDNEIVENTTSEEEMDTRTMRTAGRKGKNTIMNKDVIIHAPGGPENLVVRKMYYTPVPKEPEEVVLEVEVSVQL